MAHANGMWIPKATDTLSEYVIHIAFPLQQWLQEHASMLRYTFTPVRVKLSIQMFNFPLIVTDTIELTTYGVLKNICIYCQDSGK